MNFLSGIKNMLMFISEHWAEIITVLCVVFLAYKKVADFLAKSDEERIQIAKEQIRINMLKYVTDAEEDYANWVKAGEIKRSQVISQIYADYPILSKIVAQDDLIAWIDQTIDDALKTMRKIIEEQTAKDNDTESNAEKENNE